MPNVETVSLTVKSCLDYLLSCRKGNGAFGALDQDYTDVSWTYPAVHALKILGQNISKPSSVLMNGGGGTCRKKHWSYFQQKMLQSLLGQNDTRTWTVRYWVDNQNGRDGNPEGSGADELTYYNLSSLYYIVQAIRTMGGNVSDVASIARFIASRQAENGGFVDMRVGGRPNSETHVAYTFHAVKVLKLLEKAVPHAEKCAAFIQSCQHSSGGFGWNPESSLPGNDPDIYYTWAGVYALSELGSQPVYQKECKDWINSLQNFDGGFGDQPAWPSRLYSTYYALHALQILTGNASHAMTKKTVQRPSLDRVPEGPFQIYSTIHKMPTSYSSHQLQTLNALKFNLIQIKSEDLERVSAVQDLISANGHTMSVSLCPELHSHQLARFGGWVADHVANFTINPNWSASQRSQYLAASNRGSQGLPWTEYVSKVLNPIVALSALYYPEHDHEMEYAYISYGGGIREEKGYKVVMAGQYFHDGIRAYPWREKYYKHLTPIADLDAHEDFEQRMNVMENIRTLFIAKGHTLDDYLDAASSQRVVTVVKYAGILAYYGHPAAVHYVNDHFVEWKWWSGNPGPRLENELPTPLPGPMARSQI